MYGTVLSGLYLVVMLLLGCLILRAVSIEFRNKEASRWWRRGWDLGFALGSAGATVLFGIALGNVLRGLALDGDGVYRGGLAGLLNPFALSVGLLTLSLALLQGASWLALKTTGALEFRARIAGFLSIGLVLAAWMLAILVARSDAPRIFDNFASPLAWIGPFLTYNLLFYLFLALRFRREGLALLFSSLTITGFALSAGTALYPNLIPALERVRSLTVDNAHASNTAQTLLLMVALIGLPIVISYTSFIYWKFRGKIKIDETDY